MWTYKTPYSSEEQNKKYIEKRGRLELSRALNIGRVIGFVASGATAGYGQMSWSSLVSQAVEKAIEFGEDREVRKSGALNSTIATLKRFKKEGRVNQNATQVLGLAENLAHLAGREKEFRAFVANLFSGGRDTKESPDPTDAAKPQDPSDKSAEKLLEESNFAQKSQPLRRLISDLRVNRLLTLNYDAEIEKEFRRLFRTSGTSRRLKGRVLLDSIRTPEEQEQKPDEDLKAVKQAPESDFDALCSGDPLRVYDLPRRIEYTDGSSRSVLSVSMNGSNTADLVNFSLQPRQFMGQVVHLHGRYDKPEDIVLTDDDYRRTYLNSNRAAQTFEEALVALMTGNDILFVGVGMREADILRPLRQFISQDRTPDYAKRHVFAMLEHNVTLDMDWLSNTRPIGVPGAETALDFAALKADFKANHLEHFEHHVPKLPGASRHDYTSDEQEAVRLQSEFGVYALYHGDQWLRTVRLAVGLLEAALPKPGPQLKETDGDKEIMQQINPFEKDICDQAYGAACEAVADGLTELKEKEDPIGLLNQEELDFLIAKLNGIKSGDDKQNNRDKLPELKPHLKAILIESRSRALDHAILCLEDHRRNWWRDWRKSPVDRSTNFRRMYMLHDDELRIPTMARHRPVYSDMAKDSPLKDFEALERICQFAGTEKKAVAKAVAKAVRRASSKRVPDKEIKGGHLRKINSNDLNYFRRKNKAAGRQRDFMKVPPRRIVRVCMPRGFGKGSLLHILQQPRPEPNRRQLFLDKIFDEADNCPFEGPFRYHGAFCLHLSFSMEFSSVIGALTDFVEYALIGILVEHTDAFLAAAKDRLRVGEADTFLTFLHKCFVEPDDDTLRALIYPGNASSPESKRTPLDLLKKLQEIRGESHSVGELADLRDQIARKLSGQFRNGFWKHQNLERGVGRMHRLEELRSRISAFTDVVDVMKDKNLRIFIAMSGLDKLCDSTGSAYNPMFRALFRLLTGCGAKYASESDVTAPLDILLISGSRHRPIRYLTDEQPAKYVKRNVAYPGRGAPLDFILPQAAKSPTRSKVYLRDWPLIPQISLKERYWQSDEPSMAFRNLLNQSGNTIYAPDGTPIRVEKEQIARVCKKGVALSSWCAGAFSARMNGTRSCDGSAEERQNNLQDNLKEYVEALDAAVPKGEIAMILREILELHKEELRAWGEVLEKNKPADAEHPWPAKRLCDERKNHAGVNSAEANRMVELTYLILAHLALFPMPVEPRILYGCDEIKDVLAQICDPIFPAESLQRERLRTNRLRLLSQLLDYLHRVHLVIAVRAKTFCRPLRNDEKAELGGEIQTADDVHLRFTIQHQLRDFSARLMDLSVPDQGERNFFQLSIYCDQPRDLPSPNEDHYRLVREIMTGQIEQTRNSIWCLMQLMREVQPEDLPHLRSQEVLTDEDRDLAIKGLRRRIKAPQWDQLFVDPNLASLHAVPQRIRALYGLLRSGFSVGTVSRLSSLDERMPDQPYERFRGWLRGVTNAAIGWDYVADNLFNDRPAKRDEHTGRPIFPKAAATFEVVRDLVNSLADPNPKFAPGTMLPHNYSGFARPLYRDEIGWLLNERGLAALVVGQVFDAIPLFQRALNAMRHDDVEGYYDPSLHAAVRRVRLNMAIALIDRGHLDRAAGILQNLKLPSSFSDHSGSQVSWLADGYLGLVHHLSGNHQKAKSLYEATIERSQEKEMLRVISIFSKHLADLERQAGNFASARQHINSAINVSMQSAQKDIYHLAKVSEATIELADPEGKKEGLGEVIGETLMFSRKMGIARLECEALRLQADLMLKRGERMLAGQFASRSAAIANRNGLRLMKLSSLKFYGMSLRRRGQYEQAKQILQETKREAERRGYQNLARGLSEEIALIM